MDFIHKNEVPAHKVFTYANFVSDYCPLKSKPNGVRVTVGGENYPTMMTLVYPQHPF